MQARLHILAFHEGKNQSTATEGEKIRKIANIRIHVIVHAAHARQKFTILQSTIQPTF